MRVLAALSTAVALNACVAATPEDIRAEEEDAEIEGARQALSCGQPVTFSFDKYELVNSNSCGQTVREFRTGVGTIVTTTVCTELSHAEKLQICGDDFRDYDICWASRLTRIDVQVFDPGCGPVVIQGSLPGGLGFESDPPPSDTFGDPGYRRTDGCGFNQYGRWTCNGGQ